MGCCCPKRRPINIVISSEQFINKAEEEQGKKISLKDF